MLFNRNKTEYIYGVQELLASWMKSQQLKV